MKKPMIVSFPELNPPKVVKFSSAMSASQVADAAAKIHADSLPTLPKPDTTLGGATQESTAPISNLTALYGREQAGGLPTSKVPRGLF
jgi:hypothetical protein